MEKEDVIKLIADRIRKEQCKHGHTIDQWPEIAAAKIYKQLSEIFTNNSENINTK